MTPIKKKKSVYHTVDRLNLQAFIRKCFKAYGHEYKKMRDFNRRATQDAQKAGFMAPDGGELKEIQVYQQTRAAVGVKKFRKPYRKYVRNGVARETKPSPKGGMPESLRHILVDPDLSADARLRMVGAYFGVSV